MTTAFIDLVSEPVAALFVELVVVVFRVHGGHGSAGLRDAAFGVGQQPRADVPALRLGQHREARDDVSPGLVGIGRGPRRTGRSPRGDSGSGWPGWLARGRLRGQSRGDWAHRYPNRTPADARTRHPIHRTPAASRVRG